METRAVPRGKPRCYDRAAPTGTAPMRLTALLVSALLLVTGCSSGGGGIGDGGSGAAATRIKSEYDPRLADKAQFGRLVIAHINLGKPSSAEKRS